MNRIFKTIFTLAIGAVFAALFESSLKAEDLSGAFTEANRLYEQQRFADAAVAYEQILKSGSASAALYFNLGNAYFKSGQTGRAIAAYRNAQKIAPRDPDIRANLQFARDTVQNAKPPKSNLWTRLLDRLTLNEWAVLATILISLTFILLAIGQFRRDWAKGLRFYAAIIGIVSVVTIICTAVTAQRQFKKYAVIAADEAVLRRGPFDESQSAFTLRDGAELTVMDSREDWLQVADTSNRVGWIRNTQVSIVR